MYCARCGHELKDNVRFCPQCGSPIESVPEDSVSATTEMMHAEQEQADNASAQLQNEPTSFSTVMDETKTRSKRRIPVAVIVALALALAVGAAFATYYIYTTYAASQQAEQTEQTTNSQESNKESEEESKEPATEQTEEQPEETEETESEEPVEEESEETSEDLPEANPAYDEAMAAYGGVLDEYLAFMDFVNGGGDVDSLERDPETYALIEYPHVNDAFTYDIDESVDCNQYAYVDLDDNGIPELIVGDGSDQPIGVYAYRNGEVIFLFGYLGGARDYWYLENNGYIFNSRSGGADSDGAVFYMVDISEESGLRLVESIAYDPADWDNRNNDNSPYLITHETSEGTEEFTVTYAEAQEMLSALVESYSSGGEEIALDWQDL